MKAQHFDYQEMAELLWGKYANKHASLSLSCQKIEMEPCVGETPMGEIEYISSGDDDHIYGVVVTDHDRLSVTPENLIYGAGKIKYSFDTSGLLEGTEIKGSITLITNCGEYIIPYSIKVLPRYPDSSDGKVKTLYHFANLARESWKEALKIFRSEDFLNVLKEGDSHSRSLYKKLVNTKDPSQGLEEFLCAIKKKEPLSFETSTGPKGINITLLTEEELPVPIEIKRSGWGYTNIKVRAKGRFIRIDKPNLTEGDFLGNVCRIHIMLRKDGLSGGYGKGEVILEGPYTDIRIPVCVGRMQPMIRKRRREYMEKVSRFYRLYINYVLGKCSKRDWIDETEDLLNALRLYGKENVIWDLMRIHLLLTRERYSEAQTLLGRYYEGALIVEAGIDIGCYYLYLKSLANRDEAYTREVTYRIREALSKEQDHFYVAWLLMYLDEAYGSSPAKCWALLNNEYDYGSSSPILLLEAGELAREHPDLLMKYSSFAVEVLLFLAKNSALTQDLAQQAVYLAEHAKGADKLDGRMIRVLCECYELFGDDTVLKAICSLLIQSGRMDREALVWYRMGIRREILLTNLYESYMMSVDLDGHEELLVEALEYFSYSCELPFQQTAYLYAYIVKNKNRYQNVYSASLNGIEKSLIDWLSKGLFNENVARIFMDQWDRKGDIRDKLFNYLDVLFTHRIVSGSPSIDRFHVADERYVKDIEYSINAPKTYVGIYVESAVVIFEDQRGYRYVEPKGSLVEPVFAARDVARVISERTNRETAALSDNVLLALWGAGTGGGMVTSSNFKNALELYSRDNITDEFKGDLGSRLIKYLDRENGEQRLKEYLLSTISRDTVPGVDRKELIIMMIKDGLFSLAVTWLENYGWDMLPGSHAFFLCNHMHKDPLLMEKPILFYLSIRAYKDKQYNEDILNYLSKWYLSDVKSLVKLWQDCRDFGLEEICFGERILLQMCFSGNILQESAQEILCHHVKAGGQAPSGVEILRYLCHRHLVHDQELPEVLKRELLRRYHQKKELAVIERIVILEILKEDIYVDEGASEIINDLLPVTMYRDEIVFSFFENLTRYLEFKPYDDGKVYLSYLSDDETNIDIHYMRYLEDGTGEYQVETMNSPCPGIYTRVFPMFPGEKMRYYLTKKDPSGEDQLIREGVLAAPQPGEDAPLYDPRRITGRYNAIEGIARAIEREDAALAEESIKVYYEKDSAVNKLFKLL